MKRFNLNLAFLVLLANLCVAQIPILNSLPSVTNSVLYLDFDGQVVTGTGWNSSTGTPTINALPSNLSPANMKKVWARVSEDYRPFDINVTTDVNNFNSAPATRRMRLVITPTHAWYGNSAGGVAYLNSFSWGGNPGTPAWIFETMLSNSEKNVGEACSHEAGHTLSLQHQSTYNASCSLTAEYNPGLGSGVTSWAPIMGVGYSKNITIWHNGHNPSSCTAFQNDHGTVSPGIRKSGMLTFRADDIGDTYGNGKTLVLSSPLVLDSGLVGTPSDVDVFEFSLTNVTQISIEAKPWAFDTVGYSGANLDIRFSLFTSSGTLLGIDTNLTRLNTRFATVLNPGAYYFVIDGGRSANYSDYGSLGMYYVTVKSGSVTAIVSDFIVPAMACSGQSMVLTDASFGNPNTWLWNMPGGNPPTSSLNSPTVTFATGGVYTVSLSATNGTLSNTPVVKQITVVTTPTTTANSTPSVICEGEMATISAGGATTYSWSTGNTSKNIQVSPAGTTIYTVIGFNSNCTSSVSVTLLVDPCTGIETNLDEAQLFGVYPNPANSVIHIRNGNQNGMLEISNSLGAVFFSGPLKNKDLVLNVENWARGIYFLTFKGPQFLVGRKLVLE